MAKNKRGRHYKMTPRRRAAILKAQKASARKRRRVGIALGVVGVTVGAAAGGYALTRGRKRTIPVSTSKEIDLIRVKPLANNSNWANVGRAVTRQHVTKAPRKRKMQNYVEWERARVRKVKAAERKNYKARRKYWRSKPVGGAPRKKYTRKMK